MLIVFNKLNILFTCRLFNAFIFYLQISIETDRTVMAQLVQNVMKAHLLLRGIKTSAAIYQFLKEASELEDFGMEQYFVKNRRGETLRIGVGPTGVLIHDLNLQLKYR